LINKALDKDVYLFRRLGNGNGYPVCSEITAITYDRALHYRFGVPPECADPDHIHDWLRSHPEEWVRVFCLQEYQPEKKGRLASAPVKELNAVG
jgi:hypothetical protein